MKENAYSRKELLIKLRAFIDALEKDTSEVFDTRLHNLILFLKRYEAKRNKNLSFFKRFYLKKE